MLFTHKVKRNNFKIIIKYNLSIFIFYQLTLFLLDIIIIENSTIINILMINPKQLSKCEKALRLKIRIDITNECIGLWKSLWDFK